MELSNTWIVLTDDMITSIGYKGSINKKGQDRDKLLRFIRKRFKKNTEYRVTHLHKKGTKSGRGGHNKLLLEMTHSAYDDLLLKTRELRIKKTKKEKHYLYVMHNPVFLYYGPNVYKIGYSQNVERRVLDYNTSYIDESRILYSKEVSSKECEICLHQIMKAYRVNPKREFFDCPLSQIIVFIETLFS